MKLRWEIKLGLYVLGIIINIVIAIFTLGKLKPVPVPATLIVGFIIIPIIAFVDMWIVIIHRSSPPVITNAGHWSINAGKDIRHIAWHPEILKKAGDNGKKTIDLTIMFVGGIDYMGINPGSGSEYPVLIFPSIYEGREERSYHVYANLRKTSLSGLDPEIRHKLLREYPNRINPKSTPIYCGYTSHLDGSATPDNLKIEFEKEKDNKYITELEDLVEKLYLQLRKSDEQKSKKILIGKEVEPVDTEG